MYGARISGVGRRPVLPTSMEAISDQSILDNRGALRAKEEELRFKALEVVARHSQLEFHISAIENAINVRIGCASSQPTTKT